jgi:hypothetical protein
MLDGDKASLDKIAAPELSYGHSSGTIEDKAAFIEALVRVKMILLRSLFLSKRCRWWEIALPSSGISLRPTLTTEGHLERLTSVSSWYSKSSRDNGSFSPVRPLNCEIGLLE